MSFCSLLCAESRQRKVTLSSVNETRRWLEMATRWVCSGPDTAARIRVRVVSRRPPSLFGTVVVARQRRFWAEREELGFHGSSVGHCGKLVLRPATNLPRKTLDRTLRGRKKWFGDCTQWV